MATPMLPPGGVQPERPALLAVGEEVGDVRHRRREVAAAEAGGPRDEQQHPERHLRVLHHPGHAERRHEQEQRRDDGPVAATEDRHGEGVGDAQHGTDPGGDGDHRERLTRGECPAVGAAGHQRAGRVERAGHRDDDDRPEQPHREADVLGEDREAQVAAGDASAAGVPERLVVGVPALDPTTGPDDPQAGVRAGCGGGGRIGRGGHWCPSRRQIRVGDSEAAHLVVGRGRRYGRGVSVGCGACEWPATLSAPRGGGGP